ncbi:family 78 glycoside hydrolase catalytic domain [Allonocardiopsis opalescens]|uniref:alpha-L-rhamnosidase n=1 Tax=Allonocardiopsis opalescens TaxID=1144618 RepID=A0A2T0QF19_9ACTN|nr:family 78 glycoside hydrolase catalytic domain [Allonocardiopsis opalescens]PRY02490.1 alpha-L-rhamnosidase [Allonocardiopsis opalescens]
MSRRRPLLTTLVLVLTSGLLAAPASAPPAAAAAAEVSVTDLRVQDAPRPLGTDAARPRLSWRLESQRRGVLQTAYQIQVAASAAALRDGEAEVWDSGRVATGASAHIPYAGPALEPGTRYHWRVRVWDEAGTPTRWSSPSWWETGLFDEADWHGAAWIGRGPGREEPEGEHPPAPRLRHEFDSGGPVARARLYLSGLGYSVAHINGERVGGSVLDPGHTDYSDTAFYTVHDVTELLDEGPNAIGVELGRGFYGISTDNSWNWSTAPWWSDPELRALLVVTHPDGSTTTVVSDERWRTSDDGPTRYDEVFVGETYDARLEQPGWSEPGYDDAGWEPAEPSGGPGGVLRAQPSEPVRVTETITPVAVTEPEPGVYVFDLGVQIAGWARLSVAGPAGTEVSMRYGERLDGDGLVTIPQYDDFHDVPRAQTDVYTLGGHAGGEVWEPSYTYKGFRFVEVRGLPAPPEAATVQGRRIHSDFASVGHFDSGSQLLDTIRGNTRRALLNNHQHIPTDTPVYEKAGWTGDAQLTSTTASYEFDMSRFHRRYLDDITDSQLASGELPTIVPTPGWSYEGQPGWPAVHGPTPAWDMALFVLPRNLYEMEGDVRALERHYDGMRRYFSWLESRVDAEGLYPVGLGDWLAPGGDPPEGPVLSSTAHAYLMATWLAETAEILGDPERAEAYQARAGEIRATFNGAFLDEEAGLYRTPGVDEYRQTSNILPLAFGLVPDEHVDAVVANLVADIQGRGDRLDTGVVGTRYLLPVLTRHGHIDTAYAVATQTEEPSWGYWIELGNSSLQEHWEADTRSLNHHFFGSIGHWMFADLAGITPAEPGYAAVRIRPHIPTGLDHAEAATETVRGEVASRWRRDGEGEFELEATVPPNATGEIHVPLLGRTAEQVAASPQAEFAGVREGYAVYRVGSGTWRFVVAEDTGDICVDPQAPTVMLGDVDSGVADRTVAGSCTINHRILDEADWSGHGPFVRHVTEVARSLRSDGVIDGREYTALVGAAARSDIGRGT